MSGRRRRSERRRVLNIGAARVSVFGVRISYPRMSFASVLSSPSAVLWPEPVRSQFPSTARPATKPRTMQDEQSRKQDTELIARTQGGDAAAFDELIVKYSPAPLRPRL